MTHLERAGDFTAILLFVVVLGCGCDTDPASGKTRYPAFATTGQYSLVELLTVSGPDVPGECSRIPGLTGGWYFYSGDRERGPVTETVLREIESGLTIFDCEDFELTEELKAKLAASQELAWLRVGRQATADDLIWIGQMRGLRGLSLAFASLGDADLNTLSGLTKLQWLSVSNSSPELSPAGMLPRLPNLEILEASAPGRCCVPIIGQFPKLRGLNVGSGVTDDDVQQIVEACPTLENLNISYSKVTNASILHLSHLKLLALTETPLSRSHESLWQLQEKIPNCYITRSK